MIDKVRLTTALKEAIAPVMARELGVNEQEVLKSVQFAVQIIKPDGSGEAFSAHFTFNSNSAMLLASSLLVQYRDWLVRTGKVPTEEEAQTRTLEKLCEFLDCDSSEIV